MRFKFKYKNKNFSFNVKKCTSIFSKARGLMFRRLKNAPNLLFIFKKPGNYSIHSCFCFFDFVAVWFLGNKIIDVKIVKPFRLCVLPSIKFDKLLEIPLNNEKNIKLLEKFLKHR